MKRLFKSKAFSSYAARSGKTLISATLAMLLAGCGGGGGGGSAAPEVTVSATAPDETEQSTSGLTRECSLLAILLGSTCVTITQEDLNRSVAERQAEAERTPVAPILSAAEATSFTTILDWIPPDTSEAGTSFHDLSGYKIAFADVGGTGSPTYTVIDLDNPGLVTYVLDLPGPGEWAISMWARNSADEFSESSNVVTVIIDGTATVTDPIEVVPYSFIAGVPASSADSTLGALFAGMLVSGTFDYDASQAATGITDRRLDEDAVIYAGSITNVAGSANGLDFSDSDGVTVVGNERYNQWLTDILSVEARTADFAGFEVNGYTLVGVRLFWIEGIRGGVDDFGRPLDFLPGDGLLAALPQFEGRLALDFTSTSNMGDTVSSTLFFDGLFVNPTS